MDDIHNKSYILQKPCLMKVSSKIFPMKFGRDFKKIPSTFFISFGFINSLDFFEIALKLKVVYSLWC